MRILIMEFTFIDQSHNPKAFASLFAYLQNHPGIIIDSKKIQRLLGISSREVKKIYQELESFNVGAFIHSFSHKNFSITQTPHYKFYFADESYLLPKTSYRPDQAGNLFEQAVYLELRKKAKLLWFMRTLDGIEVDFIVQTPDDKFIALELQIDQYIYAADLQGLHFFQRSFNHDCELMVLHRGTRDNCEGNVKICPYQKALASIF